MVRGLDIFRRHFEAFADRYVLIGGTAATIAMADAGLEFRATKDLDIVLVVEALDAEFGRETPLRPHSASTNRRRACRGMRQHSDLEDIGEELPRPSPEISAGLKVVVDRRFEFLLQSSG